MKASVIFRLGLLKRFITLTPQSRYYYMQACIVMTFLHAQYELPTAATTKYHQLGGLKQHKCIILQFRRLEVQKQGVGRAMLPLKAKPKDALQSVSQLLVAPWLVAA